MARSINPRCNWRGEGGLLKCTASGGRHSGAEGRGVHDSTTGGIMEFWSHWPALEDFYLVPATLQHLLDSLSLSFSFFPAAASASRERERKKENKHASDSVTMFHGIFEGARACLVFAHPISTPLLPNKVNECWAILANH